MKTSKINCLWLPDVGAAATAVFGPSVWSTFICLSGQQRGFSSRRQERWREGQRGWSLNFWATQRSWPMPSLAKLHCSPSSSFLPAQLPEQVWLQGDMTQHGAVKERCAPYTYNLSLRCFGRCTWWKSVNSLCACLSERSTAVVSEVGDVLIERS